MLSINTIFVIVMYDVHMYERTRKILKSKSYFIQMDEQAVDRVDCVDVEDTIENSTSKKSFWRFCNSITLPRSKVVFFCPRSFNLLNSSHKVVKLHLMNLPVKTCHCGWPCYLQQLVTHYQTQNYEQNHFHKRPNLHVSGRTKHFW